MPVQYEQTTSERLAMIYEGNAKLHVKEQRKRSRAELESRLGWSKHQMLAASGFAISGSYWSLTNPRKAVSTFRTASDLYRSMGHSFWIVLALASEPEAKIPWIWPPVNNDEIPDGLSLAFGMVCVSFSDNERFALHWQRLRKHWDVAGGIPIGRLRIPLDYYGRCANALYSARMKKDAELFLREATNYINRAAEILRMASHDRFHWSRYQSRILPAEPEVIAMIRAMSATSNSVFQVPMTKMAEVDEHGRRLIEIGEQLRKAARKPSYRKQRH